MLFRSITIRVHGEAAYEGAVAASELLFGKGTTEQLSALDRSTLLSVFEGVPQFTVSRDKVAAGLSIIDLCASETNMFASKGEIRRALKENSVSLNKAKVGEDYTVTDKDILPCGLILLQRGKKNYYLVSIA